MLYSCSISMGPRSYQHGPIPCRSDQFLGGVHVGFNYLFILLTFVCVSYLQPRNMKKKTTSATRWHITKRVFSLRSVPLPTTKIKRCVLCSWFEAVCMCEASANSKDKEVRIMFVIWSSVHVWEFNLRSVPLSTTKIYEVCTMFVIWSSVCVCVCVCVLCMCVRERVCVCMIVISP